MGQHPLLSPSPVPTQGKTGDGHNIIFSMHNL